MHLKKVRNHQRVKKDSKKLLRLILNLNAKSLFHY